MIQVGVVAYKATPSSSSRSSKGIILNPITSLYYVAPCCMVVRLVPCRGQNLLILAHKLGHYIQLGIIVDDTIGEAYDKTARWLALIWVKVVALL
ncbi:putative tRNA N6-adenosine threonylcarbamoyltransferase, mitochondrial [Canna indica]|uniref:tRNA N6-adenosine threonylcarbamoyltransferase, mitochondrial n=1 Tax=Canna indica TaxID=4628 RepID=A0AAQ3Q4V8_9LILI|nr:putative tRNA N6-adenosine threonylcarbamoyltransferase, mitochondrial [Canna indica]